MTNMSNAAIRVLVAASIAFSTTVVSAKEDAAIGVGDLPCSTYIKLYDGNDSAGRKSLMQKVEQWAFGYMSGLNERANENTVRDLSYLSNSDLGFDILSECRYDADLRIVEVVTQLYENALMADPGSV